MNITPKQVTRAGAPVEEEPEEILRTLVLDDYEVDRLRLMRICRQIGRRFDFKQAANLDEFRACLDEQEFDLIFLDYHLEADTGLEALSIVTGHAEQDHAMCIMCTSYGSPDVVVTAMREGCSDYLIKDDLTPETVGAAITTALEKREILAALSHSRATRQLDTRAVGKFVSASLPQMQAVLTGMLRRLRSVRAAVTPETPVSYEVQALHGNCEALYDLLRVVQGHAREHGMAAPDEAPEAAAAAAVQPGRKTPGPARVRR